MSVKRSPSPSSSKNVTPAEPIAVPVSSIILKDERAWKPFLSTSDSGSASILHLHADEMSSGSMGFLYDYYGITEETQHGPPSPQTSTDESKAISNMSSNGSEKSDTSLDNLLLDSMESSGEEVSVIKDDEAKSPPSSGSMSERSPQFPIQTTASSVSPTSSIIEERGKGPAPTVKPENFSPASPEESSPYGLELVSFASDYHQSYSKSVENERYINILEAPTSIIQRKGDDSLTYLNKGQFYAITCEATKISSISCDRVKSYIYLAFCDEKDPRNEMNHWHFWSSQLPNPNQRAFDIDRKACQNVEEFNDNIGYNAFAFTWNPREKAKVVIRINCLSTDFSPQKGVKGIPLHLQVDTYEELKDKDADPVYRAFCQIKVFRDKGAERKNKDESKSAERRLMKFLKNNSNSGVPNIATMFRSPNKVTKFNSVSPKGPPPSVFIPKDQQYRVSSASEETHSTFQKTSTSTTPLLSAIRNQESKRQLAAAVNVAKADMEDLTMLPKEPKCRVMKRKTPAVIIYVRKEEEKVYNALMLENLTIRDLKEAVAQKYGMPIDMITNLYKKTRKGIFVNMDDAMVEQFVDEDDFLLAVNFDNQLGNFELTFYY